MSEQGLKKLRVEQFIIPIKENLPSAAEEGEFNLGAVEGGIGFVDEEGTERTILDSENATEVQLGSSIVANTFLSGPESGANAAPTFRAIVPDDIADALAEPPAIGEDTPGTIKSTTQTSTVGCQSGAVAHTATADGTGTGAIAAGTRVVQPTCDDANKIITLPAPVAGNEIILLPDAGATGYELRTSDPASISLNNVSGAGKELAVAAATTILARCVSSTAWIATKFDNVGAPSGGGTPD